MAGEVLKGFPRMIQKVLRENKLGYAIKLFNDGQHADDIQNNSWDLIPVITKYVNEDNKVNNNELFKCCLNLLNIISEKSNAEEALLQLIAELEETKDNIKFVALLAPLHQVILRIPSKKVNSLAWSFNAIQSFLCQREPPDYESLESKERLLVENAQDVRIITNLYTEVIIFYKKCIDSISNDNEKEIKKVFCKFLIQLLGKPLCYLNMEIFGNLRTDGRFIAEDIVNKLFQTFLTDPFTLIDVHNEKEIEEIYRPNILSISHFFYLVYYEGIHFEVVPKVYNSYYLFDTSVYLCFTLLQEQNTILTEKAIKLAKSVFTQVGRQNLSYLFLESEKHSQFCIALSNVIIYDPLKHIRKEALSVLEIYIKSFEVRGVYLLCSHLISILSHSGLKGFIITIYKELLNEEFTINEQNMSIYFKGPKLFSIIRKFSDLPENEESNLMENSDQIISSLNFLRYLALRDKHNISKIWDFFPILTEIFFEPLRKAIELSKAHYELEIKKLNEETNLELGDHDKLSVIVNNKELSKLDKYEQLNVLRSSLTAFDIMHSLLSRVAELIEK